ncbi:MAG TPA: Hsp20/alpha crystallin family protein [Verrucomicrobiales bacterium]|nr:Hsp20/alpha crystallin family protein [Verrucomicrobiae bacterium]MCP5554022.1 Hsp20/alpha crystallin family protein [Akkermansiaceae bacterium]HRX55272.1 Hsp20/alpha crystallin family protein [Verrucomicrobiales bacterium]
MKLVRYQSHPLAHAMDDIDRIFSGPFEGFGRLFELAQRFGPGALPSRSGAGDLYEDDHHYFVRLDLPGIKKEAVKLEIQSNALLVSVQEAKADQETEESVVYKRSVSLPEGVNAEGVTAKLEDGVLTVTLPKAEDRKPKLINID